jgi:F-type H+-transporting ATPase subunit gamma
MAGSREIRNKIGSVKNTQKITRAMEMVAASKMRKAQERMKKARPYGDKIRNVAAHMSRASSEYKHPFLVERDTVKRIGIIVVTSDKGLCGGLNTNILRLALAKIKEWEGEGEQIEVCCIGNKSLGFMTRLGANVVSNVVGLGDAPHLEKLIGAVKVILDGYNEDRFDQVFIFYTRFINAMKQEPIMEKLLPLSDAQLQGGEGKESDSKYHEGAAGTWDYIYEPDAKTVIDDIMVRYIEALIYQSLTENIASEQSARMVAMKAASDNAGDVINELTLIYNKTRQAAITKELSEIVAGAAAV